MDTTPPLLVYRVPLHKLMPTTIIIDRPLHHSYIPAGDYVQHVALGTRADCICLVPVGRNAERHINSHYWVSESEAAQYSVPFIPMDHNPPEHGKVYVSLNLDEKQADTFLECVNYTMHTTSLASIEETVVAALKSYRNTLSGTQPAP